MEGDPTSFEEAMRSADSPKVKWNQWIPTMFGTQKKFLIEPKQYAVNGSTIQNVTPKGM
jgi:hypothetical protein